MEGRGFRTGCHVNLRRQGLSASSRGCAGKGHPGGVPASAKRYITCLQHDSWRRLLQGRACPCLQALGKIVAGAGTNGALSAPIDDGYQEQGRGRGSSLCRRPFPGEQSKHSMRCTQHGQYAGRRRRHARWHPSTGLATYKGKDSRDQEQRSNPALFIRSRSSFVGHFVADLG